MGLKELRVGNYVSYKGYPMRVISIKYKYPSGDSEIENYEGYVLELCDGGLLDVEFTDPELKPLILNESIVSMFGFSRENVPNSTMNLYRLEYLPSFNLFKGEFFFHILSENLNKEVVTKTHKLQNLVLELYNVDLEVYS